jgi:hypothetical protein
MFAPSHIQFCDQIDALALQLEGPNFVGHLDGTEGWIGPSGQQIVLDGWISRALTHLFL